MTRSLRLAAFLVPLVSTVAAAQPSTQPKAFEPAIGQPGKDVMWAPTPEALLERMLQLGQVTAADLVVDLGSGDGRNVIAAAGRGARGIGVEFNPEMVELSRRLAAQAGVTARATFIQGDMFAADISKADVLLLFLLPQNLRQLTPKFLALRPGTRIVSNTFLIPDWPPDDSTELGTEHCWSWCKAYLWLVPARVAGTWNIGRDRLTLAQSFQRLTGTLVRDGTDLPIEGGHLRGDVITFSVAGTTYSGRVEVDRIAGLATFGGSQTPFRATRDR